MSRLGFVVHHDQDDHPVYTTDPSHNRCVTFWAAVKRYHMETKGWSDIAYSFGICRHGTRFEGRGWWQNQFAGGADQIADDLAYADYQWYSVLAFLGGSEQPTLEMYAGIGDLISAGRMSNHCGLAVIPHNRFRIKTCPGPELTAYANSLNQNPNFQEPPDMQLSDKTTAGNTVNDLLEWTHTQVDAIKARIDSLPAAGGAPIDYDHLANLVADKLAQRLAS